eukprot:5857095-Pleurochrysis_carterae.AAC.1
MPAHITSVEAGSLYFVKLGADVNEGELAVGLAEVIENVNGPAHAKVQPHCALSVGPNFEACFE